MPLYQYECRDCHRVTEKFASMEKRPRRTKCEYCGKSAERLIGATAIYIYSFNPMELNAERDREYGERTMRGRLYQEDEVKQGVNDRKNLSEV